MWAYFTHTHTVQCSLRLNECRHIVGRLFLTTLSDDKSECGLLMDTYCYGETKFSDISLTRAKCAHDKSHKTALGSNPNTCAESSATNRVIRVHHSAAFIWRLSTELVLLNVWAPEIFFKR